MCGCFVLGVLSGDGCGWDIALRVTFIFEPSYRLLLFSSLASPFLLCPPLFVFMFEAILCCASVLCVFFIKVLVFGFFFFTRDFPDCSKIQEHPCSFNLLFKRALKDLILRPNISSQFSLLINLALLNLLNALVQREKNNPL